MAEADVNIEDPMDDIPPLPRENVQETVERIRKNAQRFVMPDNEVITFRTTVLNSFLVCPLCLGYFRDATTVAECLHTFCKGCIFKYFHLNKAQVCPECNVSLGTFPTTQLRPDHVKQAIVEKVFPEFAEQDAIAEREFMKKWRAEHPEEAVVPEAPTPTRTPSAPRSHVPPAVASAPVTHPGGATPAIGAVASDTAVQKRPRANPKPDTAQKRRSIDPPPPGPQHKDDSSDAMLAKPGGEVATKQEINFALVADNAEAHRLRLDKPYLKTALRATVLHLKKFLSRRLGCSSTDDITVYCRGEQLPPHLTLDHIRHTRCNSAKCPIFHFRVKPGSIVSVTQYQKPLPVEIAMGGQPGGSI
eukprot:TRINITY_DN13358_c0_g1_i1.p1 TRINITY_DN13358_c0_g1~~TRINITY_DN13358_c0_g1_i1.p1  ORF type:complete len:360 (-),score=47.55 TRINITY_DN13358_c0_g1_i1:94-1173(-)